MTRIGDHWLSIREAAALVGPEMSHQRMRRRLIALHRQRPELGLVRRPGKRWFEVSAEALKRALTTDPDLHDSDIDNLAAVQKKHELQLKDHLLRIRALERGQKSIRRDVSQLALPGFEAAT